MRILLAEDERSLSNALVTILKFNYFSVDACYNGLEALSFLMLIIMIKSFYIL